MIFFDFVFISGANAMACYGCRVGKRSSSFWKSTLAELRDFVNVRQPDKYVYSIEYNNKLLVWLAYCRVDGCR